MTDVFHSCDITTGGISVKVLRDGVGHRRALGVDDYASKADYISAVASMLEAHLGPRLAAVAAVISSREDDKDAALAAQAAEHAAEKAKLEADIAALGTKEEAQAIRAEQEKAMLRRTMSDAAAQLAVLEKRT